MSIDKELREIARLADTCPAKDYEAGEILAKIVHDATSIADSLQKYREWLESRVSQLDLRIKEVCYSVALRKFDEMGE